MKTPLLYTVLGLLLLGADEPTPQPQIAAYFKTVSVHDGDTATIDVTVRMNVRLLDCWSKELKERGGDKAKAKLESLISGKAGVVTIPLHDNLSKSMTLGRVLARLSVDGKDVSSEMVRSGFATKTKEKK